MMLLALSLAVTAPAVAKGGATAGQLAEGCSVLPAMQDGQDEPPNLSEGETMIRMARAGLCSGYTQGLITGYVLAGSTAGGESSTNFCMPDRVTPSQLSRIIVKHSQDHPETEHEDATQFVVTLLMGTFPCR
ncbi:hypothetical protein IB227_02085 [Stenotrophomonas sp. STM01]|nr:hypothetical protein [Stenotrophomonas sp. STM01]